MNRTDQHAEPVTVTITGCTKEDAHAVFQVLRRSYASDRAASDRPEYVSEGHATVWTATFDVSDTAPAGGGAGPPAGPVSLTDAVEAEMQGGYWAVDRMTETLAAAFDVRKEGTAAGDQEKDVQLRLESRAA
ncbi:hypothetical protein ACFYT4_14575 [Streptomyces sp. NPDC004609]|uniref:hypothetical protein n=1 Tax=Streptomyces sp. NPDC004609 TaxID=3364704 RepID=UPI0036811590